MGWKMTGLIVLAALVFLWLIKAPILSVYLTNRLKVPVSVTWVGLWPTETTLRGFKIRNPSGFKIHHALKSNRIEIDYRLSKLFGKVTEIDSIEMNHVFIGIEFSNPLGTQNNWTAIATNMRKNPSSKEVLIHKLIVTDINVEIRGLGLIGAPQTRHIDSMEFDEINSKQGFPTGQLVQQLFQGAGIEQYIQDAFSPEKIFENITNPLKSFGS